MDSASLVNRNTNNWRLDEITFIIVLFSWSREHSQRGIEGTRTSTNITQVLSTKMKLRANLQEEHITKKHQLNASRRGYHPSLVPFSLMDDQASPCVQRREKRLQLYSTQCGADYRSPTTVLSNYVEQASRWVAKNNTMSLPEEIVNERMDALHDRLGILPHWCRRDAQRMK